MVRKGMRMSYWIGEYCQNGHYVGHTHVVERNAIGRSGGRTDERLVTILDAERRSEELPMDTPRCPECGTAVSNKCVHCKKYIRGGYEAVISTRDPNPGNFCWNCGEPYPWTRVRQEALEQTLVELQESFPHELPDHLLQQLRESVPDILDETPKSDVAVLRFNKAKQKLGDAGGAILVGVLTNVATEAVLRKLGLK